MVAGAGDCRGLRRSDMSGHRGLELAAVSELSNPFSP